MGTMVGQTMIASHARVIIITKEIPEESAIPGDVGTIIEEYRDTQGTITGYELKILSVNGQSLAMCSVPADAVREATVTDRLCSRPMPTRQSTKFARCGIASPSNLGTTRRSFANTT